MIGFPACPDCRGTGRRDLRSVARATEIDKPCTRRKLDVAQVREAWAGREAKVERETFESVFAASGRGGR